MALAGIGKRRTPKKNPTPLSTKSQKMKQRTQPLFVPDSDEDLLMSPAADTIMQLAQQESLESQENADLQHALEASRNELQGQQSADATSTAGSLGHEVSDGDELIVPGRLETALAIANAGPTPKSISMTRRLSSSFPEASMFRASEPSIDLIDQPFPSPDLSDDASLEYLGEVDEAIPSIFNTRTTPNTAQAPLGDIPLPTEAKESLKAKSVEEQFGGVGDSDEDMELVPVSIPEKLSVPTTPLSLETPKPKDIVSTPRRTTKVSFDEDNLPIGRTGVAKIPSPESSAQNPTQEPVLVPEQSEEEHVFSDWSRSPSPIADSLFVTETPASKATTVEESWDAAQEMDAHAEEGEFARFLSQVKGKDLDDVRREIDEEIKTLNQQKKAAMRDSEDITQQMIAQIMVRSYDSFSLLSENSLLYR